MQGIGVSPGVAAGPVRKLATVKFDRPIAAARESVLSALDAVAAQLEASAANAALEVAREVLEAQAMIARDPALVDAIGARLTDDGEYPDVRPAIEEAFAGFKAALTALGGYFAERVADLDEIATRTMAVLSGVDLSGPDLDRPSVVVAEDLTPADTAALDLDKALALVVAKGGPTSHTAIVARGLGIPAVVGCSDAMNLPNGALVLVDGREGVVITEPSEAEVLHRRSREDALRARAAAVTGPGRLADGTPVTLLANSGSLQSTVAAVSAGAEGIGLFRTELLFLDRNTEPTVAEQADMYRAVFDAMAGNRVILRTLDAGSDKPVPFLNTEHEENPALGVRGWRLTRIADDVLQRQLQAVADAAKQTTADVWVMAPMIDTPDEAIAFAARAREVGIKRVGVMIETPAAALLADKILAEVDFASFGTNDLTQYVMAADRLDSRLSDLTTSWHPSVLRAISQAAAAATTLARPIGVCGEAAADPQLAAILLGLGVTSLSMAPSALAEVRGYLAGLDRMTCVTAAGQVLNTGSAQEARALAAELLGS